MPKLAVVFPSYMHFGYLERAVRSALLESEAETSAVVVDDASPDVAGWKAVRERLSAEFPCRVLGLGFSKNGGLTRSWNEGLRVATNPHFDFDYACVTNNDVIFSPGWDAPLVRALESYDLVGPLTNAPGTEERQFVGDYLPGVCDGLSDSPEWIAGVAGKLAAVESQTVPGPLNGFCLFAKSATWRDNAYDSQHAFRPRNDFNSKDQPNPTPLMTLNEYELQGRWAARGLKSAIALGSFVFHYRSVARGPGYLKGRWFRADGKKE